MRPHDRILAGVCRCVCGEDLGLTGDTFQEWPSLEGGPIATYTTCRKCHSTRAFMPANSVEGRLVCTYSSAESSEVIRETSTLLEALDHDPPAAGWTLVRNGVVLARSVELLPRRTDPSVFRSSPRAVWRVEWPEEESRAWGRSV